MNPAYGHSASAMDRFGMTGAITGVGHEARTIAVTWCSL